MRASGGVMRDDQRERYARHLQLPTVGIRGQTAVLAATAVLPPAAAGSRAEQLAAEFLVAAGVGVLVVVRANEAQRTELANRGRDTRIVADGEGKTVVYPAEPAWWPAAAGDSEARAWFCGGLAALQWLDEAAR